MSTFTTHAPLREKEIRALALQAAATWAVSWGRTSSDTVLETARIFVTYIEEGRIPSDDADNLDIHGPGGTGPGR